MSRKSIRVDGFDHGTQPIPVASRKGPLLVTGGIYGLDPATGKLPDDPAAQTKLMFWQLTRVLGAAGASLDDVLRMTIYAKVPEVREHVNEHWLTAFPDADSRPARHTLAYDGLPANMLVQCDAIAMVESDD